MPRRRTQAQRRVDLQREREAGSERKIAGYTLDELADLIGKHVPAAMETLGREAAAGNVQAAKTILDFLSTIAKDSTSTHGADVLQAIARIRQEDDSPGAA